MTFDVRSDSPFVSQVNYKAIWKENLAIYQKSLEVFFHQGTPSIIFIIKFIIIVTIR